MRLFLIRAVADFAPFFAPSPLQIPSSDHSRPKRSHDRARVRPRRPARFKPVQLVPVRLRRVLPPLLPSRRVRSRPLYRPSAAAAVHPRPPHQPADSSPLPNIPHAERALAIALTVEQLRRLRLHGRIHQFPIQPLPYDGVVQHVGRLPSAAPAAAASRRVERFVTDDDVPELDGRRVDG